MIRPCNSATRSALYCFAEPVIGARVCASRWLAMINQPSTFRALFGHFQQHSFGL
jgi:hypothetical protein